VLRIETPGRTGVAAPRSGARPAASSSSFTIEAGRPASQPLGAAPTQGLGGIEALLALQAAEDPLAGRRKAVRRGLGLIEALEGLQADLLAGQPSEGRLNKLLALLGQAHETTTPELQSVIADVELRARVELAKRGHFPTR
jgi:hypothetical protein